MNRRRGPALWLLLCVGLLALAARLAVMVKSLKRRPPAAPPVAVACAVPADVPLRALPEAENPPVLAWAVGDARMFLDEQPIFSPPEAPRRFPTGEHTLKVTGERSDPLVTRIRLDAFAPALLHAEADATAGISLVRQGAVCVRCADPLNVEPLTYVQAGVATPALLEGAAASLRSDDWKAASDFLKGVPLKARGSVLFRRLAAETYADALQQDKARAQLAAIPRAQSAGLAALLARLAELEASEQARRAQVVLSRWNRTTERFHQLIDRFNADAPTAVADAARRLSDLSRAFEQAAKAEDPTTTREQVLAGAEQTLRSVLADIRASRPADCAFQADVVATVMR